MKGVIEREEDRDTIFLDEIDDSGYIGIEDEIGDRYWIIKESDEDYRATYIGNSTSYGRKYESREALVKDSLEYGQKVYLFDKYWELVEWLKDE